MGLTGLFLIIFINHVRIEMKYNFKKLTKTAQRKLTVHALQLFLQFTTIFNV